MITTATNSTRAAYATHPRPKKQGRGGCVPRARGCGKPAGGAGLASRVALWFLALLLVFAWGMPAFAAEGTSQRKTVKAGFFAWDGYHVQDESGVCSGYGYDFLKMTESYCNWKIEFVGYEKSWSDMLAMLDNGEIDVLTSAQRTPEWEEKYIFSDQPIGNSATVLSVRNEEKQYVIGDASTYDGITVGCLSGSSRNEKFKAFAEANNFTFTFREYDDLSTLKAALADKEVDAVLSTNLRTFNGETVLEQFDPVDYYAIVKKGNEALMAELDQAISKMNFNTPSWKESLQNKYFSSRSEDEFIFSRSELSYLDGLKKNGTDFTVVTNPDLAPYSSFDANGNPVGIAPMLFIEMADRIGLKYHFVSFATYDEYNAFVRTGAADIDLTCFHDYGLAADHGMIISNPYLTTSLALLSQSNRKGEPQTIGEVAGSVHNTTYSEGLFADENTTTFSSNDEMAEGIASGKVDAGYLYNYSAQKAVEQDERNRLTYTILPQYQIEMCIGTNENLDYRLISILNEGIRALSGVYTEHLIQNNITDMAVRPGLIGLIYDYPAYAIIILMSLVLVILGIFTVSALKKRAERQLAEEHETQKVRLEFFQMISHELRTPLNAAVSYLRMLREDYTLEEGARNDLDKAQIAVTQLTDISNNMLDYASISKGDVRLQDGIIKVKDLILQIDRIVSVMAKQKSQQYRFGITGLSRQYLKGDSLRVALIYQNILENAVKFTQAGGTVDAELSEEITDGEHVNLIFTCRDTGKGMSEAFTKRINEAFHQSDPSYSRTHGGLGLGLFLTQYFVKRMGGTLSVTSTEGQGTTFTIKLPFISPSIEELKTYGIACKPLRTIIYETDEYSVGMAKTTLKAIGAKADVYGDMAKVKQRIVSRTGGAYEYAVCILNVDLLPDAEAEIAAIAALPSAPCIIAVTDHDERIPEIGKNPLIAQVVGMKRSYFELFNALITIFGEYEAEDDYTGSADFSQIHAMIVEDNNVNATILGNILKKKGIDYTVCENGKIAVDTFEAEKENTYQVIFMDIQMPVMDGLTAAREIRASAAAQGATIPIIAVSANAFPEDVQRSLAAGMNAHMAKPVDPKLLFKAMEKYVLNKKTSGCAVF